MSPAFAGWRMSPAPRACFTVRSRCSRRSEHSIQLANISPGFPLIPDLAVQVLRYPSVNSRKLLRTLAHREQTQVHLDPAHIRRHSENAPIKRGEDEVENAAKGSFIGRLD